MKCIKCEKEMDRCINDGVLVGGIELIGYAHHRSKYDMGKSYHYEEIHLVVCDGCLSAHTDKPIKFTESKNKITKGMKN